MSNTEVRVFVNERGVSVPAGATALDAVRSLLPEDASAIEAGRLRLTDSRGLPAEPSEPVVAGGIYRVVAVRATLEETGS